MTLCDQIKWACCTIKGARLAAVPPPGKRGAFERLEAPRSPAPSTHCPPRARPKEHKEGLYERRRDLLHHTRGAPARTQPRRPPRELRRVHPCDVEHLLRSADAAAAVWQDGVAAHPLRLPRALGGAGVLLLLLRHQHSVGGPRRRLVPALLLLVGDWRDGHVSAGGSRALSSLPPSSNKNGLMLGLSERARGGSPLLLVRMRIRVSNHELQVCRAGRAHLWLLLPGGERQAAPAAGGHN